MKQTFIVFVWKSFRNQLHVQVLVIYQEVSYNYSEIIIIMKEVKPLTH